ncbi:MAG: UDP-3-O-acyl-N-acetylglucosamine deacetylase [Holophaga sp.]|nr:UDP-3-O-acyl-N-acetylglucosamine deacetylase [Holophaga sp.]
MPRTRHAQTLARPVTLSGHGLHGNLPCTVVLRPADQATGIVFRHLPSGVEIPARAEFVGDCSLATTLIRDGIRLQTVEHLLSALMGLEIDHLTVELTGAELPILDGSAGPWVRAIQEAGIRPMAAYAKALRILRPVEVRNGDKWMRISPYPGLRVAYTIDFDNPAIGRQSRELTLTPEKYVKELGRARTFCREEDIEWMHSHGLAKGGSLDNAVVFGPQGPLNDSLRFEDEAVRHKILDLLGDLKLLGAPLLGFVEAHCAGHALHVDLARAILANPGAWTMDEAEAALPGRHVFGHGLAEAVPA